LDWFATWVNTGRNHGWSAQAVRHGDTIYVPGQFSHRHEQFHAPAPADTDNAITDVSAMAEQMRQTYANRTPTPRTC